MLLGVRHWPNRLNKQLLVHLNLRLQRYTDAPMNHDMFSNNANMDIIILRYRDIITMLHQQFWEISL